MPFAAFIAAILSSHDQSQSVTNALQLIELLLVKMPDAYQYTFRREGVMHEVEKIASLDLITNAPKSRSSGAEAPSAILTPSERQSKDAITLRARHLRDEYGAADSEPATRARGVLERIKTLVQTLEDFAYSAEDKAVRIEPDARKAVDEIATLFANEKNPLSSFELLETGLVEGLLKFATAPDGTRESPAAALGLAGDKADARFSAVPVSSSRRQEILAEAFMPQFDSQSPSPSFAILVKRLQESLSRMEDFEVVIAAQNPNEGTSPLRTTFAELSLTKHYLLTCSRLSSKWHDNARSAAQVALGC